MTDPRECQHEMAYCIECGYDVAEFIADLRAENERLRTALNKHHYPDPECNVCAVL